jgi:hypothetical protein
MGMGARTKRAKRLAAMFDVAELRGEEEQVDRHWLTLRDGNYDWHWVPIGISVHDGSDLVAVSNFEVAERLIEEVTPFWVKYRYDSWVGPQLKTLMVRVDDAAALKAALEIRACLSDYGVLDDADLSQREHDAMMEYWDGSERGDVQSLLISEHEIPEDLAYCWGPWREFELSEAEFDAIAHACPAWQEYGFDTALDMDGLAKQVADAIRVKFCGEGAAELALRECACCGQPCYGPVWTLCDGCDHDGECDAEETWHCTGEFDHQCDGTACPQTQEEADAEAEYQARREAERMMTPLF